MRARGRLRVMPGKYGGVLQVRGHQVDDDDRQQSEYRTTLGCLVSCLQRRVCMSLCTLMLAYSFSVPVLFVTTSAIGVIDCTGNMLYI